MMNEMVSTFYFVHFRHFDNLEWSKWLEMDHPNSPTITYNPLVFWNIEQGDYTLAPFKINK